MALVAVKHVELELDIKKTLNKHKTHLYQSNLFIANNIFIHNKHSTAINLYFIYNNFINHKTH